MHYRLKKLRMQKGMKQFDVYDGIVSSSHYSNIENRRYTPSDETIKLIAERLDVPATYLLRTDSYDYQLEKKLFTYDQLISSRDKARITSFIQKHQQDFEYIPSQMQELHYHVLRFLELIFRNQMKEAFAHYELHIDVAQHDQLQLPIYKKYLYAAGLYHYHKRQYKKSIKFFLRLVDLDKETTSKIYYNISLCYHAQNKFHEALRFAKSAKEHYLKEHAWGPVGDCYNLIAVILREMKNFEEASSYITKGFDIGKGSSKCLDARLWHNLSLIRRDQGDYKNALTYIDRAILLKKELQWNNLFVSYRAKINMLLHEKNLQQAEETIVQAKQFAITALDDAHLTFLQAQVAWGNNQFEEYETLIEKSIPIFLKIEEWKSLQEASEHYSQFLERNTKYKKALEQQKLSNFALKKMYEEDKE